MRTLPALMLVCLFAPGSASAEKVPMSKAALTKTATHIVTGEVMAIYTREAVEGRWRVKHRVAEVKVATVEKGDRITQGDLVYARYWTRRWVGPGEQPPSTGGHAGLPKAGAKVRVYLAQNAYDGAGTTKDGGFNVVFREGFEDLN